MTATARDERFDMKTDGLARYEPEGRIVQTDAYEGMTLAVSPTEAHRRVQELRAFVKAVMVEGEDYGKIPGVDKDSLFQPGAQKLAEIYGLAHRFEPIETVKDWDRGFFYFEYRCVVTSRRDGRHICEGIGSCNSKESKYADRWAFDRDVPAALDKRMLKTKSIKSKKNGQTYTMYQVPNPDPYSLVNTIQKMAAKRAYVHAIVSATRSAGVFTQDAEDLPRDAFGEAEDKRSWEGEAPDPQPARPPSTPPPAPPVKDPAWVEAAIAENIKQAPSIPELKKVVEQAKKALKAERITLTQAADLRALADKRKAQLEAPPDYKTAAQDALGDNELPASYGGPAQPEEACMFCEGTFAAGEERIEHTDRDGVVGWRHNDCTAFEHR